MNSQPTPTIITLGHQRLHRMLSKIGLICEDEVRVGRYMLDVYVRDYHIAFEYDGPSHRGAGARARDAERDSWLLNEAGIIVFRTTDARLRDPEFDSLVMDVTSIACADLELRLAKREKWPL